MLTPAALEVMLYSCKNYQLIFCHCTNSHLYPDNVVSNGLVTRVRSMNAVDSLSEIPKLQQINIEEKRK